MFACDVVSQGWGAFHSIHRSSVHKVATKTHAARSNFLFAEVLSICVPLTWESNGVWYSLPCKQTGFLLSAWLQVWPCQYGPLNAQSIMTCCLFE
eukprot:jgi/Mesvir1/1775/Mv25145-RA.1